jgi:hypothetical protein
VIHLDVLRLLILDLLHESIDDRHPPTTTRNVHFLPQEPLCCLVERLVDPRRGE